MQLADAPRIAAAEHDAMSVHHIHVVRNELRRPHDDFLRQFPVDGDHVAKRLIV
ncbi:hypothetical protein D3C72_2584900 [compost metagenome]